MTDHQGDPVRSSIAEASSRAALDAAWGRSAFNSLVAVAVVLCLGSLRLRGQAPLGADAPQDAFAEARARSQLVALVPSDDPRPLGSAAHDRTRDTLVARFRALGCETAIERSWQVAPASGRAAWVENVIATVHGKGTERPVLVVAHYDSVGAGPGAADDGMSLAAMLETVRAIRAGPAPARSIVFLATDGEESGLLGAYAHMASRSADAYHCVLNFEARGNLGASLCFQTGRASAAFVDAWARHSSRPIGSSAFAAWLPPMSRSSVVSAGRNSRAPRRNRT